MDLNVPKIKQIKIHGGQRKGIEWKARGTEHIRNKLRVPTTTLWVTEFTTHHNYHTHVEMCISLSTASSAPFFHATKISQLMLSTDLQRKITLSNWSPKLNVSTSAPQILRTGTIKAPIRKKGGASKQKLDVLNL